MGNPRTAMEDLRKASIKPLVQSWIQENLQSLREKVLLTWEEGVGQLQPEDALLEKILEAAGAQPEEEPFPDAPESTEYDLGAALDLIESSLSQGEVLKNLLEGLQPFVERSALFVVKQNSASLFAHRGFESDHPRLGAPVQPTAELSELVQGHISLVGPGETYLALLGALSRFEASDARVLPLRLRRKPVALLLVDSGIRQVIDHPHHVRALAHAAEAALSFQAGQKEEERPPAPPAPEAHPAAQTLRLPEPPIAEAGAPPLDPKIRANAERSARVLVGDIELYFPAKVAQGKAHKNLYALLRDELERSKASFVERYGAEVEEQHHIFQQTVIHQLCDDDASLLGAVPWSTKP